MTVAVIGDACIDQYADGRWYSTGNAVDTAVHLHLLGTPTTLITAVGDDEAGTAVLADLASAGLDTTHVHRLPGRTAVTHMDLRGTDRVHGDYEEGVLADLRFSDADVALAADHDLVHTAYWGKADDQLPELRAQGALLSFDFADRAETALGRAVAPLVDVGFYSFEAPDAAVCEFLRAAHGAGMRYAVATFGERGSLAYDGTFHEFGIVRADVVNTVGAGDAFIAGFLHVIAAGGGVPDALACGARTAASIVAAFDPWPSARSLTSTQLLP